MTQREKHEFEIDPDVAWGAQASAADDRRDAIDDRHQRGLDAVAILFAPEVDEGGFFQIPPPQCVNARTCNPEWKFSIAIDFEKECVGQNGTDRAGIRRVRSGAARAPRITFQ